MRQAINSRLVEGLALLVVYNISAGEYIPCCLAILFLGRELVYVSNQHWFMKGMKIQSDFVLYGCMLCKRLVAALILILAYERDF